VGEIDQRLEECGQALETSHKELLRAILYKRAEQIRSSANELVAVAKRYQQVAYLMGLQGSLQDIRIPLPPTHREDRFDYVGPHTIRTGQRDRRLRNCCWTESTHHQRGTPFSPGTCGAPPQIKRCFGLKDTRYVAFSFSGTPGTPFFEGYWFLTSVTPSHSEPSARFCTKSPYG